MSKGLVERDSLTAIANAIRSKTGSSDTYTPAEMASAIQSITTGDAIDHEDLPAYVKAEAADVARRIRQHMQADSIIILTGSDSHQIDEGDNSGYNSNTGVVTKENATNGRNANQGNSHSGMAMKALTYMIPFDFAAFLGDYTTGNSGTTIAEGKKHFSEINSFIDEAFRGLVQFRTVGNHDPLGYSKTYNGGTALTPEELYSYIGKYNDDGVTVMGSRTAGYCYRDFSTKSLRVICLNTADTTGTNGDGEIVTDVQKKWFADTLISTPQDYGILILAHHPLDWGNIISTSGILRAYVEEKSGVNIGGTTYDFSGKNKSAWQMQIHGHTHCFKTDKLHWNNNGTGEPYNVYRIASPCMNFSRTNEYGWANQTTEYWGIEFGQPEETRERIGKVAGGGKDTAFCVYVINPTEQTVYAINYGAGYDRSVYYGENSVAVTGISFEEQTGTLIVGGTKVLTPIITPSDATNKTVIWTSSNSSVASVSNGTITAVSIGNATITATTQDGGFSAVYVITVEAVKIEPTNEVPTSFTVKTPYDETSIYNSVGYKNNTKLGSGGGQDSSAAGYVSTGLFHIPNPDQIDYIYVRGADIDTSDTGCRWAIFGYSGTYESYGTSTGNSWDNTWFRGVEKLGTEYYRLSCSKTFATQYLISKERYMRFSFKGTGEHLFVSIQNPILDEYYPWGNLAVYSVTSNLTNVVSDNPTVSVYEGAGYAATLSATPGHTLNSVVITMAGVDVTSSVYNTSTGVINIPSVNGNIIITASASEGTTYTNMVPLSTDASGAIYNGTGYKAGYRLNSSGNEAESSPSIVSGYIPYNGEVIRAAYFGGSSTLSYSGNYIALCDANKSLLSNYPVLNGKSSGSSLTNCVWTYDPDAETNSTIKNCVLSAKYIRISISQYQTPASTFTVTLDENI